MCEAVGKTGEGGRVRQGDLGPCGSVSESVIGAAASETSSGAAKSAGGHDEALTYTGNTVILSALDVPNSSSVECILVP